jgi:hypothetical protein
MNAYADKTKGKPNHPARGEGIAPAFADQRADAYVQRARQEQLNVSQRAKDLQAISRMQDAYAPKVAQLEMKNGPDGTPIDVTLIFDCLPVFLEGVIADDADYCYCRTGKKPGEWNDTDYFYIGDDDRLVQLTVAMVNEYWDAKYPGFARTGLPVLGVNCEDYATDGKKMKDGKPYAIADPATLSDLLATDGNYVVNFGSHWLKVEKAGDSLTIRQKDGESAYYSKSFTKQGAVDYICDKTPEKGSVYAG